MAAADVVYRCFVGGLPWAVDENGLQGYFKGYGDITECKVISDRETGRSKGFGFVTFSTEKAMNDAIQGMDGKNIEGRNISVNVATPRQTDRDRAGSRGGRRDTRFGRREEGFGGGYGGGNDRAYGGGGRGYGGDSDRGYGGGHGYGGGNNRGYGGGGRGYGGRNDRPYGGGNDSGYGGGEDRGYGGEYSRGGGASEENWRN